MRFQELRILIIEERSHQPLLAIGYDGVKEVSIHAGFSDAVL